MPNAPGSVVNKIRGIPFLGPHTPEMSMGNTWIVSSTHANRQDSPDHGADPTTPFSTIDYAIGQCTASNGDTIYVLPGHAETLTAAGSITCDVAGIRIVGLGTANVRPTISYSTSANASVLVSAANVRMENLRFDMTGIDSLNNPINVQAAGCQIVNCEFEFADSGGQADNAITTNASANDLLVEGCYLFGSADAGTASAFQIVGGDSAVIRNNIIVGSFTANVGGIRNQTTAATNLAIVSNYIDNRTATSTKALIVDGATTGILKDNNFQILSGTAPVTAAGMSWSNNVFANAVATEPQPLSNTDDIYQVLCGTTGIATFPAGAAAANNVSMAEALRYAQENIRVGTGTALPANTSLYGVLAGAEGLATFPTGAAAANAVSLAEVLRYIQENVIVGSGTVLPNNQSLYGILGGAEGLATFPAGAAAANAVSLAEVLRYIQENVIVGTGDALPGNSSLAGILAGATGVAAYPAAAAAGNAVSLAEVLRFVQDIAAFNALNYQTTNYLAVTADMAVAGWETVATHEILTVTGNVRVKIVPVCTGDLTSAGVAGIQLGVAGTTNAFVANTTATGIDNGEAWLSNTPAFSYAVTSVVDAVVSGGTDVGYEIDTAALTGGSIVFHCWWQPLSSGGAVVAGAGGAL